MLWTEAENFSEGRWRPLQTSSGHWKEGPLRQGWQHRKYIYREKRNKLKESMDMEATYFLKEIIFKSRSLWCFDAACLALEVLWLHVCLEVHLHTGYEKSQLAFRITNNIFGDFKEEVGTNRSSWMRTLKVSVKSRKTRDSAFCFSGASLGSPWMKWLWACHSVF